MTLTLSPPTATPEPQAPLQPQGWLRYFSFSVDHKVIGLQYLVCGFLFYLVGGALAGMIRTELLTPMSDFMPRETYNEVLTLHGTVMIFLWQRLPIRLDRLPAPEPHHPGHRPGDLDSQRVASGR